MTWAYRGSGFGFALRFALLCALLHAPLPLLADAYTTAFDVMANAALRQVDRGRRLGFRFEPPADIGRAGSWNGVLRVEDRTAGQVARMKLDVRTFSYRPLATFLALALAARLRGIRRNAAITGAGAALMILVTSSLALVASLHFGIGRLIGFGSGSLAETAYEALTTPAMTYALPFLVYAALAWLTRDREKVEPLSTALLAAEGSPESQRAQPG